MAKYIVSAGNECEGPFDNIVQARLCGMPMAYRHDRVYILNYPEMTDAGFIFMKRGRMMYKSKKTMTYLRPNGKMGTRL